MEKLEVSFYDNYDPTGNYLVVGFHGVGNIGYLSIRYLIESALDQRVGKQIGHIITQYMPPFVEVIKGGTYGLPYELYGVGNLILLLIRVQPTLDEQAFLAESLVNFVKERRLKGIILTGGIDVKVFKGDRVPETVFVANRDFIERIMKGNNLWSELEPVPANILVSGGVALFLAYATHRRIPAIALFAPTEKGIINIRSSISLTKTLIKLFKLPINTESLDAKLKAYEEALQKQIDEQMKSMEEMVTPEWAGREPTEDISTFT